MTSRAQAITLLIHAAIALALLVCATVLAWHKTIDSQAYVAIISTVVGLVGGSAGTLALVGFQQPPANGIKATVQESVPPVSPGGTA